MCWGVFSCGYCEDVGEVVFVLCVVVVELIDLVVQVGCGCGEDVGIDQGDCVLCGVGIFFFDYGLYFVGVIIQYVIVVEWIGQLCCEQGEFVWCGDQGLQCLCVGQWYVVVEYQYVCFVWYLCQCVVDGMVGIQVFGLFYLVEVWLVGKCVLYLIIVVVVDYVDCCWM